jgi:hypothetical protein
VSSCSLLPTFLFAAGAPRIPMTAPQFRAQRPLAMWSYVEFILEQISWMAVQSNVWNYEMICVKHCQVQKSTRFSWVALLDWSKTSKTHEKGPVNHMKANANLIILCKRAGLLLHLPSKIIKVKSRLLNLNISPAWSDANPMNLMERVPRSPLWSPCAVRCMTLYDIVWLYDVICPA